MGKNAKSKAIRKAAGPGQLWLHLPGLVREALYETVIAAGLACVAEVLEAERSGLCGARYQHVAERQALRAGCVASSLTLGGRRVAVIRTAMNQAYATRDAKRARRLLDNLARRLEDQHPGAAASLREGLDETLTVMRLGLPDKLERVLCSTNLIENLFSRVREIGRRVRRWQSGTMVLRWSAAGVLEAERGFRRIVGYRAMPLLAAALRARDAKTQGEPTVDDSEKAA